MKDKYKKVLEVMEKTGIIPVIKLKNTDDAAALADALINGDVPVAEVTFRAEGAAAAIESMRNAQEKMLIGAGTVLSIEQAESAVSSGAEFIVTPGSNPKVMEYCLEHDIPIFPGCATPTEIEAAMGYGLAVVKFFPAEQFGGAKTIKAFAAPYSGMRFIPTGGISLDNLGEYIANPAVIACGGSFMVKASVLEKKDWQAVTTSCKKAQKIIGSIRSRNNG